MICALFSLTEDARQTVDTTSAGSSKMTVCSIYVVGYLWATGKWLLFDDDKVTETTEEEVLKLSGGGGGTSSVCLLHRLTQYYS